MAVTLHSFKNFPSIITPIPVVEVNPAALSHSIKNNHWESRSVAVHVTGLNNDQSRFHIDTCIEATVCSQKFRDIQKGLWGSEFSKKITFTILSGIGTVFFAGKAYNSKSTPPVAFAMFSVACLIGTVAVGHKAWTAWIEKAGWSVNPVQVIAQQRTEGYKEGFRLAKDLKLDQNLQKGVLLPLEVNFLFKEYSKDFCNKLVVIDPTDSSGQHRWLTQFIDLNPVSRAALQSAYDGFAEIPRKFEQITNFYENLLKRIQDIQKLFTSIRTERTRERNNNITKIEDYRNLALAPFKAYHDAQIQAAKQKCKAALRKVHSNKKKIKAEYSAEVTRQNLIYAAYSTPIILYAQYEIGKVEASYKRAIDQINTDEKQAIIFYYTPARQCLAQAKDLIDQQDNAALPVPSAPPIEIPEYNVPPVDVYKAPEASAPPPFQHEIDEAVKRLGPQFQHSEEVVRYQELLIGLRK